MAAFVTFEDVSKVYRSGEVEIRAVDHISFTIEKGEFCVIVGPSGAGKTTVLNMLGGMDACSGGTITVDGTRVSGFNARQLTTYRRHDIGFVFQFYNLVGNLTALENVELAAQICKTRSTRRRFWTRSALPSAQTTSPVSSPAASSSAWRSPARWRRTPSSFCATSRRARSTM